MILFLKKLFKHKFEIIEETTIDKHDDAYYKKELENMKRNQDMFEKIVGVEPMDQIDWIIKNSLNKYNHWLSASMNGKMYTPATVIEAPKRPILNPYPYTHRHSVGGRVRKVEQETIHVEARGGSRLGGKRIVGFRTETTETIEVRGGVGGYKLLSWDFGKEVVEEPRRIPDYVLTTQDAKLVAWDKIRDNYGSVNNALKQIDTWGEVFDEVEKNKVIEIVRDDRKFQTIYTKGSREEKENV